MSSASFGDRVRATLLGGVLPLRRSQLPAELAAGATLAALAIPEVMGYTKIAGTPVITGLYTLLIPVLLFAVFGSSRHLVVSADSATAAILAAGLVGVAGRGTEEYVALAGVLALMAAGLLCVARLTGLAFMADFLSRSVLIGFLTGVGLQVALGQVPGMLGLSGGGLGTAAGIWRDLRELDDVNATALGLSLAVIGMIAVSRRISARIPAAMVAVVGAIVASWWLDLGAHVRVLGPVPSGLPAVALPPIDWSWPLLARLLPTAAAMFVVILAQSAATSRAYAARYDERVSENGDLVGLAVANLGAGLSGTFVVNGSPTKTQMVDSAGGRTQLSMLFTTAIVLVVLLFLTGPLAYLPDAVLAAVVFLIGIELIDVAGMRRVQRERPSEFWVALVTAGMVVFVGVEQGIMLAIVLSLVVHTRHGYRPRNGVLGLSASGAWRTLPLDSGAQLLPGLLVYRFTHSLYYANCQQFSEEVARLVGAAEPPLRWLCLDATAIDDVDFTAAETLRSTQSALARRGIRLVVAEVQADLAAQARKDLQELSGDGPLFDTLEDVVEAYRRSAELDHAPAHQTSGDSP